MNRYSIVKSSDKFAFLVWDTEAEDFVKKANGHFVEFEDETQAKIFIDNLTA